MLSDWVLAVVPSVKWIRYRGFPLVELRRRSRRSMVFVYSMCFVMVTMFSYLSLVGHWPSLLFACPAAESNRGGCLSAPSLPGLPLSVIVGLLLLCTCTS